MTKLQRKNDTALNIKTNYILTVCALALAVLCALCVFYPMK